MAWERGAGTGREGDHLPTPALLDRLTENLEAASERPVDPVVLNIAPPLLAREVIPRGRLGPRTGAGRVRPSERPPRGLV
jgi:hypothetical protein